MAALLARVFGLDLRSLALLRIGTGLLLLVDLAVCAGDLRAHYTDFGILPRAELGLDTFRTVFALHGFASPYPAAVALLFALAACFAVALTIGWHTWLATFGSWLLLASLQHRNPALVFGGDVMLLFWGLSLPLVYVFSVLNRAPVAGVGTPRVNRLPRWLSGSCCCRVRRRCAAVDEARWA